MHRIGDIWGRDPFQDLPDFLFGAAAFEKLGRDALPFLDYLEDRPRGALSVRRLGDRPPTMMMFAPA